MVSELVSEWVREGGSEGVREDDEIDTLSDEDGE
jgi:hypothetical protein